jgi:hypothetical protein
MNVTYIRHRKFMVGKRVVLLAARIISSTQEKTNKPILADVKNN